MQISGSTQRLFGELCSSGGTFNAIRAMFRSEGFETPADWDFAETGVRRDLVDAFHHTIDFNDADQVRRVLRVYDTGIEEFGRSYQEGEMVLDLNAKAMLRGLDRDGVEIEDEHIVFPDPELSTVAFPLSSYPRLDEAGKDAVREHLRRIQRGLKDDAGSAIGSSKDLLETVCKIILDAERVEYGRKDDLPKLYGRVADLLRLKAESVADSAKGSAAAQQALRSLVTCVHSLSELRNQLGGHGQARRSPGRRRHAELAFNSARTVAEFLLQTWHEQPRTRAGEAGTAT